LAAVDAETRAEDDLAMTSQGAGNHPHSDGHDRPAGRVHRWVLPPQTRKPVNPALVEHARQRAEDGQNQVADKITEFAGSMTFVYIHLIWFGCWIGFGVENYPYGLLTMIVSLEAIFLSTFVLISQNRADGKRLVIADQQWATVQVEEKQNEKLLDLSEQMLRVIEEVRTFAPLAQAEHEQNKELLDLSRRTLALTTEVHQSTAAGQLGSRGSVGSADPNVKDH
jgi:uncharacterized membrane protein